VIQISDPVAGIMLENLYVNKIVKGFYGGHLPQGWNWFYERARYCGIGAPSLERFSIAA